MYIELNMDQEACLRFREDRPAEPSKWEFQRSGAQDGSIKMERNDDLLRHGNPVSEHNKKAGLEPSGSWAWTEEQYRTCVFRAGWP